MVLFACGDPTTINSGALADHTRRGVARLVFSAMDPLDYGALSSINRGALSHSSIYQQKAPALINGCEDPYLVNSPSVTYVASALV